MTDQLILSRQCSPPQWTTALTFGVDGSIAQELFPPVVAPNNVWETITLSFTADGDATVVNSMTGEQDERMGDEEQPLPDQPDNRTERFSSTLLLLLLLFLLLVLSNVQQHKGEN